MGDSKRDSNAAGKATRRNFLKSASLTSVAVVGAGTTTLPSPLMATAGTANRNTSIAPLSGLADGHWAGQHIWTNPVQDWRLGDGTLECIVSGGERNAILFTHAAASDLNQIRAEVVLNNFIMTAEAKPTGYAGFMVGVKGQFSDYRDSAIRGQGMKVGLTNSGTLFIGAIEGPQLKSIPSKVQLSYEATSGINGCELVLRIRDSGGRELAQMSRKQLPVEALTGCQGLVCHAGDLTTRESPWGNGGTVQRQRTGRRDAVTCGFSDWMIEGDSFEYFEERRSGPILFAMYGLNRGLLKLTAQMAPVATNGGTVKLATACAGAWKSVADSPIDRESRTAHFRVTDWQAQADTPYRLSYSWAGSDGSKHTHHYYGTIKREPIENDKLNVASLSCQFDLGFPHQDMVPGIEAQDPDFIIFAGDQFYEANAGYGVMRGEGDAVMLDYLRKWYQFGWAFGDLLKDRPSVLMLDDHDVYQGNIWGAGGRKAVGRPGAEAQDSGGFIMPAAWVNMAQRTQCSHLPDPASPTPADQGIQTYYTGLVYAGISFAVLEDRKWKSAPKEVLPWADFYNGFGLNRGYDARKHGDAEGAQLLGSKQEEFLEDWANDWSGGAELKAVISQTIFTSLTTRDEDDVINDRDVPAQAVEPNSYPANDLLTQDHDSNAWPQTPRIRALRSMRKGFALNIAGDTHLGSTLQYGIDDWGDGPVAIGSPAISNLWPRRWFPQNEPRNRTPGQAKNLGEHLDGFGNKITVMAVANPTKVDFGRKQIYERAPGYNMIRFDKVKREIEIVAWPRWVNPTDMGAKPFDGWPITISQLDNGYPKDGPALPALTDLPIDNAAIQLVDEESDEIVYTLRIRGKDFTPRVFKKGRYTARIFDADMKLIETRKGLKPSKG